MKSSSKLLCALSMLMVLFSFLSFRQQAVATSDFAIGETWIVDGQWELTVTGASLSLDRNPYSDKNPQATYIVDFTYRNIGYENDFLDGLIFSMSNTIVDSAGRMGYSYPNSVVRYPQMTPVGATCDAQVCIGVDNAGPFRITVSQYDGNTVKQQATFFVDKFSDAETDQSSDPAPSSPTPSDNVAFASAQVLSSSPEPLSVPTFDHATLLGDKAGYSYDKFDQKWIWYSLYTHEWSDAKLQIGLQAFGEDHGPNLDETDLFIRILDLNGNVLQKAKALDFLINGVTYSYEDLIIGERESSVPLAMNGNLLIEALAFCDANDVSFRFTTDVNTYVIELDPTQLTWTLKDFCRTYLIDDLWAYCVDPVYKNDFEAKRPLKVNGVVADYATMHQDRDLSQLDATFTVPKPTPTPAPTPTPTPKPAQVPQHTQNPVSSGNEINPSIPLGTYYDLGQGEYECGDDIPAGRYLIEWISGNPYGGYINAIAGCEQFGYQVSIDPELPFIAEISNGDQFEITLSSLRFTKVTSLPNETFRQDDGSYLMGPGTFYAGIDIPTGKYNATAVGGNPYGMYIYVDGNMMSLDQGETYNNLKLKNPGMVVELSLGRVRFSPVN